MHRRSGRSSLPAPPPPRGACHRAGHFGPDPLAWSPSPTSWGRTSKRILATRLRPSYAVIARGLATKQSGERVEIGWLRGACHRAGHFGPDPLARNDKQSRGSGTPTGAVFHEAGPPGTAAHPAGCARLSAFRCGACCGDRTPQLNSNTRFLGPGIHQVLPASGLSQSSELLADRSSCRPGVFAGAARERR